MRASRPSSERSPELRPRRGGGCRSLVLAALVLLGSGAAGCATVSPAEKEYLADPAMTFGSEGKPAAHSAHVYANREGSFGARGAGGGGCGCN